ncbi:hypothetical protein EH223_07865 [candidate division KSB1 bacterium]|nr:hypothetical protein [candidate division KSB1 bacterium]RQW04293.1 MAG: hypothetical protein EH223_07865 [candidate division KSB1 bacterium]
MKKASGVMFFIGLVFMTSGGLSAQKPAGESTVVGGIVIELYGSYWIYNEPVQSDLPIRVAVEYVDEKDKRRMYAYRIRTDENGYFKIENAPAGKYIFKAVEFTIGQSVHITAASEYGRWQKGETYRFWGMMSGMMYHNERDLIETQFENDPQSGRIDLGITYLKIKADERLGGTPLKNYSPNGTAPWIRLSLHQGYKIADLSMVEYKTFSEIIGLKMEDTDLTINMPAASVYFELGE